MKFYTVDELYEKINSLEKVESIVKENNLEDVVDTNCDCLIVGIYMEELRKNESSN